MKIQTTARNKIVALLMELLIRGKKVYKEDSRENTKSGERGDKVASFPLYFRSLVPWEEACSRILRLTLWLGFHAHQVTL